MSKQKLILIKRGQYKLAEDWEARYQGWNGDLQKFFNAGLKPGIQPNTIVFPAGLLVNISCSYKWGVSVSIFKKYNKGTGIPSFYTVLKQNDIGGPVLELP